MARHGSIREFDAVMEDWTAYTERLEQYLTANDVEDATKHQADLLSVCMWSFNVQAHSEFSGTWQAQRPDLQGAGGAAEGAFRP